MYTAEEETKETKVQPQDTVTATSIHGSNDIYIDPVLERRTMAKYDKFLLPQMAMLIILAYLDRSNIGKQPLLCSVGIRRPLTVSKLR